MPRYSTPLRTLPHVLFLPASLLLLILQPVSAACTLVPGPGNDNFTCDSGTSSSLTDLAGNNSLTLPANSTGQINGGVTFGAGADRVEINSGVITGAVSQGNGVDDFVINGGSIGSLAQGDSRDTFLMTGGTIVGAFEDGDVARMTGGTIGRVDMKLDNNIFNLSGGQIFGNLVTGFGTDTIIVSGGRIGGNISVSGGNDSITVSGGEIVGEIRASVGDDAFMWDGGGIIRSAILMDIGNDTATLRNLDDSILALTPSIDGGVGTDTLTLDNTRTALPVRLINWETVNLSNASQLDLGSSSLVLGDAGTGTGALNIDASSTLFSTQGSVAPALAGQNVTLNNAGIIDLTQGNSRTNDTLTVQGNYVGNRGQLLLQSAVAGDDSASDRLIINNGSLGGSTVISVSNVGGLGALTQVNGIELVQAQGSAVSSNTAFTLSGPVSAGAYDYYLFKGGVTAGTENNWYLRSAVVAPQLMSVPNPDPALPPLLVPVVATPIAAAITPLDGAPGEALSIASLPVLPAAVAGAAPIPLYRPEVPTWSVLPPAAAQLTLNALGTFHDRQGEQRLLSETGAFGAGWGRVYGKNLEQTWAGTVTPRLDGSLNGFQVGNDLFSSQNSSGQHQRVGFFVGHSRLQGDVDGFNEGFQHNSAGKIKLEGDSYGLYWTLTDPYGWYVDTVVMGTRFDGDNHSDRGVKLDNRGHALTLSAEAGYPLPISDTWVIEPQAQVIHQKISLDSQDDGISRVSFDSDGAWTGRLGARLKGRYQVSGLPVEPYLRANLWHTFSGTDSVTFGTSDVITTEQKSSTADIGLGVVLTLDRAVSVYASTDYTSNIDSNDLRGVVGNLGVRISW
ncbi:autotransporter outer membrane beta-barrel domain-containing protein [Pseudomonas sp. MYb2]|uniref:autotransporter family protein n=1 Tax=unclassified Pseudomonas TaxID=196821 RepID=UPI000CFF8B22|nr:MULTISPECIES: autotransporter outer membrane beta-barrel domain-containing protein [unclassified Pseudomonas]PRB47163.1 autotransporter outer membrane beta-barrel domain-containing protein [Pseudomonas sp. MYb3]PRC32492.1 autotransporter outer membrane beta-barrel domain-containing protein [Pseudomonas sp. MYb2]